MKTILSASILAVDFSDLGNQIRSAEAAGVDWIHIDVMDGHFVPNITMGTVMVEACRRNTNLPLDVHLMIEYPERHIEAFAKAGADWITVHIENNANIHRTLQQIQALRCKPGIVLNPGTPACSISATLPLVEMVLVMTVNPGFGGQAFIPETLSKIKEIRRILNHTNPEVHIQVDGGVSADTVTEMHRAGANVFVAGTAIFGHPRGIQAGVDDLRNAIK